MTKWIEIVSGDMSDYKKLARFHYREAALKAYAAVYAMRFGAETVGVIVYTMPSTGCELRNVATGNLFSGLDRSTRLKLINANIRCIGRVIIEPRFRVLSLASRLVRETMPKVGVPIVEALAVMGVVNPFFEKAGMKAYTAGQPARCVQLIEAFSMVGVEENEFVEAGKVQQKLNNLASGPADFIEEQIKQFLMSYGKSKNMQPGPERTRFVLSKLTARPVYYIWFNEKIADSV